MELSIFDSVFVFVVSVLSVKDLSNDFSNSFHGTVRCRLAFVGWDRTVFLWCKD